MADYDVRRGNMRDRSRSRDRGDRSGSDSDEDERRRIRRERLMGDADTHHKKKEYMQRCRLVRRLILEARQLQDHLPEDMVRQTLRQNVELHQYGFVNFAIEYARDHPEGAIVFAPFK